MTDQNANGSRQSEDEGKPATIRWDASAIKNAYANVWRCSSGW